MQKWIDELRDAQEHLQQEVSQLKKQEAKLEISLSILRSIIESTANGIVAVNLEGEILSFNQKFVDMWQIPESLMLSKNFSQASAFLENQLKNAEAFRGVMWEVSSQPDSQSYDILELMDGRVFAQYSLPQWLNGKIIGRVWSIWEISDCKQVESELRQALEQAQEYRELRANFVSVLCHQFRTPLNVISFSNSLLQRQGDEWRKEKTRPLLEHIQTAIEKLSQMLDDVILFAKAETAKLNLEIEPLDLLRFCNEIVVQIQMSHSQNSINFLSQGSCLTTCIDQRLLEPILKNLLDNAVKYSPVGSAVDLELFCEEEKVIFQVTDRGVGIPVVDKERIFEPFYRGKNSKNLPGTGLGLSVVKTLVDLHRGQINLESEVGTGTKFTVALPSVK
ncbi:PAS domain-containing sensor histidine kinase [Nostoc sp. CENA67]|uniref:histidine kinase n=1 Tax=Amazonocrinis nigriterrae CENA67 TaxID=2794033 RepID=A0A8J7HWR3_9NOST|nr:PAS domain-containing sensor histidine kinase [Amazonocrinis nigriterrae]MBH8564890.1 PAS domain-containing sensor histidine kinase [Amazonocrinis nigriterrae CENA67]